MEVKKKGKVKFKNKAYRRVANAWLLATGIFTCGMLSGIYPAVMADNVKSDINDICLDIRSTESFMDYIKEKNNQLNMAYDNEILTNEEYHEKLYNLNTNQYIVENAEHFAPEKTEEIEELQQDLEKHTTLTLGLVCGFGALAIGSVIPGAIMSCDSRYGKQEEKEM